MPSSLRFIVPPAHEGEPIDAFLGASGRLSRAQAEAILRTGGVFVNRRRVKAAGHRLSGGDRVEVHLLAEAPAAVSVPLIYADAHLVIADKPGGMPVDSTRQSDQGTLVSAVTAQLRAQGLLGRGQHPRAVHRLDREVTGAVALALTREAAAALSQQLATHDAGRRYLALVHGAPPEAGRLADVLIPHPQGPVEVRPAGEEAASPSAAGKLDVTRFRRIGASQAHALLEIDLETGRKHQIRAQLAAAGWPLVGDLRYDPQRRPSPLGPARLALHAFELSLDHPVGGDRRRFTSPLPSDLGALLHELGLGLPSAGPSGALTQPSGEREPAHV